MPALTHPVEIAPDEAEHRVSPARRTVPSTPEEELHKTVFDRLETLGIRFDWYSIESEHPTRLPLPRMSEAIGVVFVLQGGATLTEDKTQTLQVGSTLFLAPGESPQRLDRVAPSPHQLFVIYYSLESLRRQLTHATDFIHPVIRTWLERPSEASTPTHFVRPSLSDRQGQLVSAFRHPPVLAAAQELWYPAKATELVVELFLTPPPENEPFCLRQNRIAEERVRRTIEVLKANIEDPPKLPEIGKQVGCSPYYLSRTFSKEMGMTIPQFIRKLRMERAAELLREGRHNVTEVALMVGYNSISHFSQAFCQTIGCCPTLYPHVRQ